MTAIRWPDDWQLEARAAIEPYLGSHARLRIIVGTPTSIDGTVLEGFVFLDGEVPTVIHNRDDRPGTYPWPFLRGPVLRILELRPRRTPLVVFAHPDWTPRSRT
ncbi:hypothetical protein ACGGZK_04370 [Agromyces sp. MMS24-K17]|uniref:hypothetical protein n=1 Tax=Agromyces sp. MMS24-K17 TaxID=3372850 RepID=UPI003754A952